jgi:hypothetical protein
MDSNRTSKIRSLGMPLVRCGCGGWWRLVLVNIAPRMAAVDTVRRILTAARAPARRDIDTMPATVTLDAKRNVAVQMLPRTHFDRPLQRVVMRETEFGMFDRRLANLPDGR